MKEINKLVISQNNHEIKDLDEICRRYTDQVPVIHVWCYNEKLLSTKDNINKLYVDLLKKNSVESTLSFEHLLDA